MASPDGSPRKSVTFSRSDAAPQPDAPASKVQARDFADDEDPAHRDSQDEDGTPDVSPVGSMSTLPVKSALRRSVPQQEKAQRRASFEGASGGETADAHGSATVGSAGAADNVDLFAAGDTATATGSIGNMGSASASGLAGSADADGMGGKKAKRQQRRAGKGRKAKRLVQLCSSAAAEELMIQGVDVDQDVLMAIPEVAEEEYEVHTFTVGIVQAQNLRHADVLGGKSDPFCELTVVDKPDIVHRTPRIDNDVNPTWNSNFNLADLEEHDVLRFDVYDEDLMVAKGDHLGHVSVAVKDLLPFGMHKTVKLEDCGTDDTGKKLESTLMLMITVGGSKTRIRKIVPEEWGIVVTIVGAQGLRTADLMSSSDPFCECYQVSVAGAVLHKFQTHVVNDNNSPTWNVEEIIWHASLDDRFEFKIWDNDVLLGRETTESLGHFEVKIADVFPDGFDDKALKLEDAGKTGAKLIVCVEICNALTINLLHVEADLAAEKKAEEDRLRMEKEEEERFEQAARAAAEAEDQSPGLGGYRPEPFHVRAMARAELRRTKEEIPKVEQKINDCAEVANPGEEFYDDDVEPEVVQQRLAYQLRLLELRRDRLRQLCPRTFWQLPEQCIEAARDGDADYVRFCYDAGVDLDVRQEATGTTPLIAATVTNKVSVVRALIECKADPAVQDENLATCAHYAVQLDHIHIITALLEVEGFNAFTVKDGRGMSAVDYARRPDREPHFRYIRSRMGGPGGLLMNIFRGWFQDVLGVPRQEKAYRDWFRCDAVTMAERATPIVEMCSRAPAEEEDNNPAKKGKRKSRIAVAKSKASP